MVDEEIKEYLQEYQYMNFTKDEVEAWIYAQTTAWNWGVYKELNPIDFIYECRLDCPSNIVDLVESAYKKIKENNHVVELIESYYIKNKDKFKEQHDNSICLDYVCEINKKD